jgi:hypothetical protein
MRLSRHAKNKARWTGLTLPEVEGIVSAPERTNVDASGNPRYYAHVRDRLYRVVVAQDDPSYVITIHERRE